jgi:hypothetical protein
MPDLDDIRYAAEAEFKRELQKLDRRNRAKLMAALERYGHPRDIPQAIWDEIQREYEEAAVAIMLIAMLSGDEWTTDQLERQGLPVSAASERDYALTAARQAQISAAQTTNTLRNRLIRKVEDELASIEKGGLGALSGRGAERVFGDVLTDSRWENIATSETTGALTTGQRGAGRRMGGDGAATADGQRVEVEMRWRTENDNRVCPRCAPLEGTNESVWGLVFPDGPGEQSHTNCRCWLEPVVVVRGSEVAA